MSMKGVKSTVGTKSLPCIDEQQQKKELSDAAPLMQLSFITIFLWSQKKTMNP